MDNNLEQTIRENVKKTVKALKRDGTTAMGLVNLFQITPTSGINCHPAMYRQTFDAVAPRAAKELHFPIY